MPHDIDLPVPPQTPVQTVPAPDDDAPDGNDIELDVSAIANLMADLSREGALPEGVEDPEPTPFTADDMGFSDNDWLRRIIEIQGWLCLDRPLSVSAPVEDTIESLFGQLTDGGNPTRCFTNGGSVALTELGTQLLEARLNRALEHRLAFEDAIDEGRSRADASAEWRLYWEELASQSRRPIERIHAKVESWKIRAIKNYAEEGLLDLNPSYQRDIVWSNTESQLLIESILRGIPLPSVILTQEANSDRWQIVDGKQRLTAILRFSGHHPDGRAFAKDKVGGLEDLDKNIRRFIRRNHLRPKDLYDHFLPFRLRKYEPSDPIYKLSGKFYSQIRDEVIEVGNTNVKVSTLFESEGSEYLIPVITYKNTPIQDIHHVFSLYNKQGKKLNAEELRNAMYHHLDFTKLLLVLSGDRADQKRDLTPYLPREMVETVDEVGALLKERNFGTARFKRTKVLSWASAILFHRPSSVGGQVSTPSTTGHINAMLEAIGGNGTGESAHKLFQRPTLIALARDIQATVTTHQAASDGWSPKFRNKKGLAAKWEELPLVASLVGTMLLVSAGKGGRLVESIADIREFTTQLRAPTKTQNKTQWQYIAKVATGLLTKMEVNEADLGSTLESRYGYNCLPTLRALAAGPE